MRSRTRLPTAMLLQITTPISQPCATGRAETARPITSEAIDAAEAVSRIARGTGNLGREGFAAVIEASPARPAYRRVARVARFAAPGYRRRSPTGRAVRRARHTRTSRHNRR